MEDNRGMVKSIAQQLDEYRPDMPKTATVALADIFNGKLTAGHTLDPNRTDIDILYEARVRYLADNPQDINFMELSKAGATKEKVELTAGDEFCRLMASFQQKPVTMVDGVEVVDK